MRFKVDENLPAELASDLRSLGHDAETVTGENLAGTDDATLVAVALHESRILITLDKGIADVRRFSAGSHAGIVLLRPGSVGRRTVMDFVRARLNQILVMDLRNRLTVVSDTQIRVR